MWNRWRTKTAILTIALGLTFISIWFIYKEKNNKEAQNFFKHGIEFYNEEKYQDAYYNFNQIKKSSDLYSLALLKQFQCADKLKDSQTALIKLDLLQKRKMSENIRSYILFNELKYNEETHKYSKLQQYKRYLFIYNKYPKSDFAQASTFKLAKLIYKKDKRQAKDYFINYLNYAPKGRYSKEAIEGVLTLKDYLTKDDLGILAKAYLENQQYQEAQKILKDLNFESNWYNLALAYRGLKNYTLEQETIIRGLDLEKTTVDEKDISNAVTRLIKMGNFDKIQSLEDMHTKFKGKSSYPTIAYKLAQNLTSIRAIKLYEHIIDNYPNSIWASNSMWEVFWYDYSQERYKTCIKLSQKHYNLYPKSKDAPRLLYWQGKALLKEKEFQEAKEKFSKVLKEYPLSYYAFLSIRQLKLSKANKLINKKPIQNYDIDLIAKHLFKDDKEILLLLKYNDFSTIEELKINDDYIKSWIYNKKKMYPESIKLASDALNEDEEFKQEFQDYKLKLIYPIKYEELINKYAQEYKLSPYLFMSLIREESHFNSNAKSPVGALGLSQIMPATASHIENYQITKEELLNPKENIRMGEKYFKYLLERFNGNVYLAILSYNAGFGNVEKWLNDPKIASNEIDVFIENIPFNETKMYIKKILSSYFIYQNIYSIKNRLL